ncbi:MAG: hypothetical protein LBN02_08390, partial [Oscillospiraceae bacterium]|nr:hypothetical protein [Oscillospiraceae bacterium]
MKKLRTILALLLAALTLAACSGKATTTTLTPTATPTPSPTPTPIPANAVYIGDDYYITQTAMADGDWESGVGF